MLKRSLFFIVISASVLLIGANLVLFTITQNGATGNDWLIDVPFGVSGTYEFRGFMYLYKYLSTFPGLTNSLNVVNTVANTVTGQFDVTGYGVLDAVLGVLLVLITPINLLITFVIDVISNIIWVFNFFIPNFIS